MSFPSKQKIFSKTGYLLSRRHFLMSTFLMSKWNFLDFSLCPLPVIISLGASSKVMLQADSGKNYLTIQSTRTTTTSKLGSACIHFDVYICLSTSLL